MARSSGRIRSVADDGDDAPQSMAERIQNLIDQQLQRIDEAKEGEKRREERDGLSEYYDQLRRVTERDEAGLEAHQLEAAGLADLAESAVVQAGKNALRSSAYQTNRLSEGEIAAIEGVNDPRLLANQAAITAMNATRRQIRQSLPVEIVGSAEYQALVELTKPRGTNRSVEDSTFTTRSGMHGRVRSEVRAGRLQELVERVDEQVASDEVERLCGEGVEDQDQLADARATYHEIVDRMSRKRRRGEDVTAEDVQLVATHRLRLMEGLRNYVPEWAPENPQRWISLGDRYVFDISLAAVPEDLIRSTAAYDGMQDLMRNEALFILRAPEHAEDAIGRKASEIRRESAEAAEGAPKRRTRHLEWLA